MSGVRCMHLCIAFVLLSTVWVWMQDVPDDSTQPPSHSDPDAAVVDGASVQPQAATDDQGGSGAKLTKAQRQRLRKKLREAGQ